LTNRHYLYQRRGKPINDQERVKIAEEWGTWKMKGERHKLDDDFYAKFPNRDVPRANFPSDAWQVNSDYMSEFLQESLALVDRAMEGILSEYGHGKADTPKKSFDERSSMFQLNVINADDEQWPKNGGDEGGWTTNRSWEGLKRRLLHAIMTEDSFVFSMGGHSAAAGHGNHFQQSYTLQVAWILEPIFARLGVKHQSRNYGNGGLGTIHNALGAGSIYGPDVDVLMWDSEMTEKSDQDLDLFARQGLLGGRKVPFLWSLKPNILQLWHERADVDVGTHGTGRAGLPFASTVEELENTPWAARYMACHADIKKDFCDPAKYNGTCWIDRTDFTPTTPQKKVPSGRAGWHPGHREHQLTGRVLAFTLLKALREVLEMWSQAENQVLPDDKWHVAAYYENIRKKVLLVDPDESGCGELKKHNLEFFCKHPFQVKNTLPWAAILIGIVFSQLSL
jgi:hypothetical protein